MNKSKNQPRDDSFDQVVEISLKLVVMAVALLLMGHGLAKDDIRYSVMSMILLVILLGIQFKFSFLGFKAESKGK